MRKFVLLIALIVFVALPAVAQEAPRAEIFGGYSLVRLGDGSPEVFHGFQASVAGNFNNYFGIVGDFGGQFKSIFGTTVQTYEYMAGPRFYIRGDAVTGFAHTMLGGITFTGGGTSDTGFAIGLGGGVDVNVSDRFAIRVFQLDYLPIRIGGQWATENFRVGVGVVIKLGGGS